MGERELGQEPVIGVSLDVLRHLADDLDSNEKLRAIFGDPVSGKVAVVSVGNDLKIVEYPPSELGEGERRIFLEELDRVMRKRLIPKE